MHPLYNKIQKHLECYVVGMAEQNFKKHRHHWCRNVTDLGAMISVQHNNMVVKQWLGH